MIALPRRYGKAYLDKVNCPKESPPPTRCFVDCALLNRYVFLPPPGPMGVVTSWTEQSAHGGQTVPVVDDDERIESSIPWSERCPLHWGGAHSETSDWRPLVLRKRSAPALTVDVTAGKVRKRKRRRGGGSWRESRANPPVATPLLDASQADFPGNESEVQADLGRFSKQAIYGPAGFHSRVLATTFTRLAAPRLS